MSTLTAESVLQLMDQLPPTEQSRLRLLMEQRASTQTQSNGTNETPPPPPARQLDQRMPPKPMPDSTRERQWLKAHRREYAGQWVALDGDRLVAASPNHDEVWAAADADGAWLPLITFIEDPDKIYIGL